MCIRDRKRVSYCCRWRPTLYLLWQSYCKMRWKHNIFWLADTTRQCNKSSHVKMNSLQRCQVLTFPRGALGFSGFDNFLDRFFGFSVCLQFLFYFVLSFWFFSKTKIGFSDLLFGDAVWCFYGFYSENTRVNAAHINYDKKKKQNKNTHDNITRSV